MNKEKREYKYSSFETFNEMDYDEMIFSDFVKPKDKDNFIFIEGKIISRGKVNLKFIEFSDKAISQAVKEFKPHPLLIEHKQGIPGMVGTVIKYVEDNKGLKLHALIPKTTKNEEFIELMQNDVAGLIKMSIGGLAFSIKCSICDEEVYKDYDHIIGRKYKFKKQEHVCHGIVDDWKTIESTFTIFPADVDTYQKEAKFAMGFSTGFDELDVMLDEKYKLQNSDTFINEEENRHGDTPMKEGDEKDKTDAIKVNQSEPVQETVQDTTQMDELKAMVLKLSEDMASSIKSVDEKVDKRFSQIDNEKKSVKIVELSTLTGEDTKTYLEMSEDTIEALLGMARKNKAKAIEQSIEVPEEAGSVDDTFRESTKMTRAMNLDAVSIMLGFKKTFSEMNDEYVSNYGVYGESTEDKINRILNVRYAPKE
jgi:hypothetical protein